jgi:type 1 glutamine amidotransferase
VQEGVIEGKTTAENPTEGNTFLVWRDGQVDDFELRLSFKIMAGNSGIQFRSKEEKQWVISGYQADIDYEGNYIGAHYEEKGRGLLAQRGQQVQISPDGKLEVIGTTGTPEELKAIIKKDDWNDYVVLAQGNRILQSINGHATCEIVDNQVEKRAMSGLLALQLHQGPSMTVQFKNLQLKRLPLKDAKKVVLVAGKASHAWGEHDHPAGVSVLKVCLEKVPGVVVADYYDGWPKDPTAFDNANTIAFYMDGGAGHPMIQGDHLQVLDQLMKKGVGLACLHYAVEVPKDRGGKEFLDWIGGYYETGFSTNPHWDADIKELANHPINEGVTPFKMRDEWYYNMRFRKEMQGVTPLIKAIPPDNTRGTAEAAKHVGRAESLAWCTERPDGGRGLGFTGGHFHEGWRDENFRRFVLNGILWTAGMEIPEGGIQSSLTEAEFSAKLRPKP